MTPRICRNCGELESEHCPDCGCCQYFDGECAECEVYGTGEDER